jgi:hypothetical protein
MEFQEKMAEIAYDTLARIIYQNATDFFSLHLPSEK